MVVAGVGEYVFSLIEFLYFVTVYDVWCDEIEQNRRLYTLVIFFHHFSSTKHFTPKNVLAPPISTYNDEGAGGPFYSIEGLVTDAQNGIW